MSSGHPAIFFSSPSSSEVDLNYSWWSALLQVSLSLFRLLVFALLGFLSPSNRGALTTVMIILYVLFGSIGGFVSSYTYKILGGENWKLNIAATPLLIPGYSFKFVSLMSVWYSQHFSSSTFFSLLRILQVLYPLGQCSLLFSSGSWFRCLWVSLARSLVSGALFSKIQSEQIKSLDKFQSKWSILNQYPLSY